MCSLRCLGDLTPYAHDNRIDVADAAADAPGAHRGRRPGDHEALAVAFVSEVMEGTVLTRQRRMELQAWLDWLERQVE